MELTAIEEKQEEEESATSSPSPLYEEQTDKYLLLLTFT